MSSLKQYIDLYTEHEATVRKNSPELLNSLRDDALDALKGARLPDKCDERSQHTSVEEMMAPDYGINIARLNIPVEIARSFACNLPTVSTAMGIVVNDRFVPTDKLSSKLPEGVIFESLAKLCHERPELIAPYLNKIAPSTEPGVALNTLLLQDGAVLYVKAGVRMDRPLQLVNIFSAPIPTMALRRLLIVIEKGAEAKLVVCDHTQDDEQAYLSSQVTEIYLEENATLDLYMLEEASSKTTRYAQTFVRQNRDSKFNSSYMALSGGMSRSEFTVDLTEPGAKTSLGGGILAIHGRHVDCHTDVNHRAPHCESEQTFRYVVADASVGVFDGSILVTPQAPFTTAYQSNRNVLASAQARMHSKPRLEIYNDDVKCSHGSTIGQLDEEALFYMRSRGIPESEARVMLMQAFMADVIDCVNIDTLRERLRHLVEIRFNGQDATCKSCSDRAINAH